MLTVFEFYAYVGENVSSDPIERRYVELQIGVAEEAIRNYTRRYISPMVWEDRFQRPDVVNLVETPLTALQGVFVDGYLVPEEGYYYHATTSRLFRCSPDMPWGWPIGVDYWTPDRLPDALPQYYHNWHGVGALVVLYKAGFDSVPAPIKQVIVDYVHERLLAYRTAKNSGGVQVPVGTIAGITIEGVGSVRYSTGASTTANGSRFAMSSGEPVIGAAGALLDAYLEVARVVPGLNGLVSHKQAILLPDPTTGIVSEDATDSILYSDDSNDIVVYGSQLTPGVVNVQTVNPQVRSLWSNVWWNGGYLV